MDTNKVESKKDKEIRRVLFLLNTKQLKVHSSKTLFTLTVWSLLKEVEVVTLKKQDGVWEE
jgi:hypothetical protein